MPLRITDLTMGTARKILVQHMFWAISWLRVNFVLVNGEAGGGKRTLLY